MSEYMSFSKESRIYAIFRTFFAVSKTACPEFEPLCPCQNKRPPFGGLLFSYGDPQRRACFSSEKRMGGAVRTPESFCAPAKENPRNPHKHLGSENFSFPLEIQIVYAKSPFFPHFPQLSEKKRCQLGVKIT
jgi:hypothetical protein